MVRLSSVRRRRCPSVCSFVTDVLRLSLGCREKVLHEQLTPCLKPKRAKCQQSNARETFFLI